jgi:hypothetical protein
MNAVFLALLPVWAGFHGVNAGFSVGAYLPTNGGDGGTTRTRLGEPDKQSTRHLNNDFLWDLSMRDGFPQFPQGLENVTDQDDDIVFSYNYTGTLTQAKTLGVQIFQYDCVRGTDSLGVNISDIDINTTLGQMTLATDIDITKIVDSTAHYQQVSANNATISFCVRVDYLYTGPDKKAESMNFYETKVQITVDLLAGFNLTAVNIQTNDPSSSDITLEIEAPILAYFCDENFTDIGQPVFSQGEIVVGCMAVVPEKQNQVNHPDQKDLHSVLYHQKSTHTFFCFIVQCPLLT